MERVTHGAPGQAIWRVHRPMHSGKIRRHAAVKDASSFSEYPSPGDTGGGPKARPMISTGIFAGIRLPERDRSVPRLSPSPAGCRSGPSGNVREPPPDRRASPGAVALLLQPTGRSGGLALVGVGEGIHGKGSLNGASWCGGLAPEIAELLAREQGQDRPELNPRPTRGPGFSRAGRKHDTPSRPVRGPSASITYWGSGWMKCLFHPERRRVIELRAPTHAPRPDLQGVRRQVEHPEVCTTGSKAKKYASD